MNKFVHGEFLPDEVAHRMVKWIGEYMEQSGGNMVVVGVSGGIDSTTCLYAAVAAVGPMHVLAVRMPDGDQADGRVADEIIDQVGVQSITCNIRGMMDEFYKTIRDGSDYPGEFNDIVKWNAPARARMMVLYGVANQVGGRVVNTCNRSESYVGYDTKWGDQCGDFAPLASLTKTQVRQVALALGVPYEFVIKPPTDGLCGITDEQRFGFTYETLDAFLMGEEIDIESARRIEQMHKRGKHKECVNIPTFGQDLRTLG